MGWAGGMLTLARDERVILLSIGLATFGVVSAMLSVLTMIRDENQLPPQQPKTQYITQDTEDALPLETIQKLLDHPNYSIREIAVRILCERAINDSRTIDQLLHGITRPNYDLRMQCLRTLALITGQPTGLDGISQLNNTKGYSALVRSLELSLDDVDRPDMREYHWDDYLLRDMAERFCLMFIVELTSKFGAHMLLKAKFVERWLVKQNWGDNPEEIRQTFKEYMRFRSNRISDIVSNIQDSRRGKRALVLAGLIDQETSYASRRELPDLLMEYDEAPIIGEWRADHHIPRAREHSAEEQRLRRQHREAMVLNDGTRPLGRDDIIERDHGSPA